MKKQLTDLLYQALESEQGGKKIYAFAVTCAVNKDLKEEWTKYLAETTLHEEVILDLMNKVGLNPKARTPGRRVVAHIGKSLLKAMQIAQATGDKKAAELVAAECVVLAETKDHMNWSLIGEMAKRVSGADGKALKAAHELVEGQEDEHLYHTTGWTRELWLKALGVPAVLPPPEEEKEVKTAIGASRAKQVRRQMQPRR